MNKSKYFILPIFLYLLSGSTQAVDINISITGSIYIPPCVINNNIPIQFSFNQIMTYKVDGQTNAITKNIPITCTYFKGSPYVKVSGIQLSGAPDNVLQVSADSVNAGRFGLALYQGDSVDANHPLRLNGSASRGYEVTKGFSNTGQERSQFSITAVPFKTGTSDLSPGNFTASASLSIVYN
ncbi:TPA: fimbrial protein [Proteus mirabilis]